MSTGLLDQSSSCCSRLWKLISQTESGFLEGHETLVHDAGSTSRKSAFITASMASDMVSSPLKPSESSLSDRTISCSKRFITSISCKKTFWYGPFSSRDPAKSSTSKRFSANRSRMSSSLADVTSVGDVAPSSAVDVERGCSSTSVLNMESDCDVRKSISAFGCRPNATGVSPVSPTSTCSRYFSYDVGAGHVNETPFSSSAKGYISVSSKSSSFMNQSRYVPQSSLSKSLTMWPPYIISPKRYLRSCHGILPPPEFSM
mmetsp:Transcript_17793/g.60059  ORF Transcript_17793/g.60059 Transcript_17793/m.60059 type:complete len:259 (-) Transcript_17793:8744-9520(-)